MTQYLDDNVINMYAFDGQTVWYDKFTPLFEVGNFLGGGAAGTVYECEQTKTKEHFALKILNPIGYKGKLLAEHVWWLLNTGTKQYIPAFYSEKASSLKELALNQCIEIWGISPACLSQIDEENPNSNLSALQMPSGQIIYVPKLPPKYVEYLRKRSRIFREIRNMRKLSNHKNVIRLEGVLELIQETKSTIFLVMELANGGELFDRIKVDCGTREETAKFFFQQLLGGIKHCHDQGVCHRDLKPENLLLQDIVDSGTILKIADFGFSARFAMANSEDDLNMQSLRGLSDNSPIRVLNSVVGSPFYVAPEVLQAQGYDGTKADVWSLGVILYAMLAGNLPFGQELGSCKRFKHFCKWVQQCSLKGTQFWGEHSVEYPEWLFPAKFSAATKGLIVSMLYPDPKLRITIIEAMLHPLCECGSAPVSNAADDVASSYRTRFGILHNIRENDDNSVDKIEDMIVEEPDTMHKSESSADESEHESDEDDGLFAMEEDDQKLPPTPAKQHQNPKSNRGRSSPISINGCNYPTVSTTHGFATIQGSSSGTYGFELASSPLGTRPPTAPTSFVAPTFDDLIPGSDDEMDEPNAGIRINGSGVENSRTSKSRVSDDSFSNAHPPSFHDLVKRSTRFITAVPAAHVLSKIERILEECRATRAQTSIGFITRVQLNWTEFKLEAWGTEAFGPPLFSLQLYEFSSDTTSSQYLTPTASHIWSDVNLYGRSPAIANMSSSFKSFQQQDLYLAEFVRGQIEIFAFKRFYDWLRQRLSELVKRDYAAVNAFEQAVSPKVDFQLLQRFQQMS